jgi:hypothetical protein
MLCHIYCYDRIFVTQFLKPNLNHIFLTVSPHHPPTQPHKSEKCWVRAWCYVMF